MSARLESLLPPLKRAQAEAADMAARNGLPPVFAAAFVPLVLLSDKQLDDMDDTAGLFDADRVQELRDEARDDERLERAMERSES